MYILKQYDNKRVGSAKGRGGGCELGTYLEPRAWKDFACFRIVSGSNHNVRPGQGQYYFAVVNCTKIQFGDSSRHYNCENRY